MQAPTFVIAFLAQRAAVDGSDRALAGATITALASVFVVVLGAIPLS